MVLIICCISSGWDLCKFITFEKGTVLGLQSFFSFPEKHPCAWHVSLTRWKEGGLWRQVAGGDADTQEH